jgi:hypothetical protein
MAALNHYRHILIVLRNRKYTALYMCSAGLISLLYVFLLPTLPFGAFVPQAVSFITPIQLSFAVVFGVLLGLLVTLTVYGRRMGVGGVGAAPVGSVAVSLVNLLCCTPIIPVAFGLAAGLSPVFYGLAPKVQYFFAKNYAWFYAVSTALLLYSVHRVLKNISCCVLG